MITLSFYGKEFVLGNVGGSENPTKVHMTNIHLDGFCYIPGDPENDRTITPVESNTPHALQWVERAVVLGSRMALVAPMHYSTELTDAVIGVCRSIDAVDREELPEDECNPFFQGVADKMLELYAPAKALRALKDDFGYILAYMPPYRTTYRLSRNGDHTAAIEETAWHVKRPVYVLRESNCLWDCRRAMAQVENTLSGRGASKLVTFDAWDDVVKSV